MRRQTPEDHRSFAKEMRNEPTAAEAVLWDIVRGKKLEGLRFRRQHPIAGYIVDFICLDEKLIVEVDGGQHSENSYDEKRDADLTALGFQVVRFWNDEVIKNVNGVAQDILHRVGKSRR